MNLTERKLSKSIELSTAAKNFNGANNKWFEIVTIPLVNLAKYLTQHNYATIHWQGGSRDEKNFVKAVGFVGDYDSGERTIQEVHDDLFSKSINHLIIPSRSHTAEHHRFHVVLKFDHPVYAAEGYKQIADHIIDKILPGSDPNVSDAARFIYGSLDDVDSTVYWDGKDLEVSGLAEIWTQSTEILDKKGSAITVSEISVKTPIFCPFHEDSNPSAFIDCMSSK